MTNTELPQPIYPNAGPSGPKPPGSNGPGGVGQTTLIIGGAVIGLVVIVLAAVFLLNRGGGSDDNDSISSLQPRDRTTATASSEGTTANTASSSQVSERARQAAEDDIGHFASPSTLSCVAEGFENAPAVVDELYSPTPWRQDNLAVYASIWVDCLTVDELVVAASGVFDPTATACLARNVNHLSADDWHTLIQLVAMEQYDDLDATYGHLYMYRDGTGECVT